MLNFYQDTIFVATKINFVIYLINENILQITNPYKIPNVYGLLLSDLRLKNYRLSYMFDTLLLKLFNKSEDIQKILYVECLGLNEYTKYRFFFKNINLILNCFYTKDIQMLEEIIKEFPESLIEELELIVENINSNFKGDYKIDLDKLRPKKDGPEEFYTCRKGCKSYTQKAEEVLKKTKKPSLEDLYNLSKNFQMPRL